MMLKRVGVIVVIIMILSSFSIAYANENMYISRIFMEGASTSDILEEIDLFLGVSNSSTEVTYRKDVSVEFSRESVSPASKSYSQEPYDLRRDTPSANAYIEGFLETSSRL